MAATHPDLALGFEDDVGWSREAQPQMPAWSDDTPVRLGEQTVPAKDPAGKAVAGDGRYVPTANQMVWRFVGGRPVSVVTCTVRAWLTPSCTAPGTRALVLIWDQASWHVSQAGQAWITSPQAPRQTGGGCRVMVGRLPRTRPWRNPLEPKWVHGKRAVMEPARVLSTAERIPRVCASYQGELTDPIAPPDC